MRRRKKRKDVPFFEVSGSQLIEAMSRGEEKKKKRKKRIWRVKKGEVISASTMRRHNRNCQCNIDPIHCPVHGI